jgi:hypothetical protein
VGGTVGGTVVEEEMAAATFPEPGGDEVSAVVGAGVVEGGVVAGGVVAGGVVEGGVVVGAGA